MFARHRLETYGNAGGDPAAIAAPLATPANPISIFSDNTIAHDLEHS